ncbi:MAG: class I SAM-dependent methyltransferase [Alphaproteobacteria bacterium]|nr:class I SAM-dependent methyltransferase [Alphaproteobacteria bacterium]
MSALASMPAPAATLRTADSRTSAGARDLDALIRFVASNRFMPAPPDGLHNVGDGDWRAIGAEFLGHFVRLGGLAPDDRVLEIGCGTGRMALPLTQYLDPGRGSYEGVDVVAAGIAWAQRAITARYPAVRFHHVDAANSLYNPAGAQRVEDVRLPYADASFDFAIMTSLITHLEPAQVDAYVMEIGRLLRIGGRCFVSLFLLDDAARAALRAGAGRIAFDPDGAGPAFYADPERPLAAVAYEQRHLLGCFARAGLFLARPIAYGGWSGRSGGFGFQDICVFARRDLPRDAGLPGGRQP